MPNKGNSPPVADVSNSYVARLNRISADILRRNVADIRSESMGMAHINRDNDWVYRDMAQMALALGCAWHLPQAAAFQSADAWAQMERLLRRLLDAGKNGKWWREQPGTGDNNLNRFTLLPLMDLFLRIGGRLDPALRKQYLDVIDRAVTAQISSYHQRPTRLRGEYPNMDAYFMLIMEEASRILNRADCHALALEYLGGLETCLFPGGGFVYFKDTNECELYHQLIVMLLLRMFELTHAARVRELLRRTLPYYPNAVEPSGVAEYYTDPFWKHCWTPVDSLALDVLATLFPDEPASGAHRFLANIVRRHAQNKDYDWQTERLTAIYLVWGLDYWDAAPGEKPRDDWVRYDDAIRGPRGRFGDFSWAATTGACVDTFVGAMVAAAPDQVSALEAVGAAIVLADPPDKASASPLYGRRHGSAAYVSGRHYQRRVIVNGEWACLAAWSPLFIGGAGWDELLPDSGWHMHQVWWLARQRLVGAIAVAPAHAGCAPAVAVNIYARLGGTLRDVTEQAGIHRRGDLCLRLVHHNFPAQALKPAYRFYLDAEHTSTELVLSAATAGLDAPLYTAIMEIFPAWHGPADITALPACQGTGFTVSGTGLDMAVAFNATGNALACDALATADAGRVYHAVSGSPCVNPAPGSPNMLAPGALIAGEWSG